MQVTSSWAWATIKAEKTNNITINGNGNANITGGIDDDTTFNFLTNVIKLFVSADRNCTELECKLFNDVMGTSLTYEQFYNLTNGGSDPEFVQAMDELIDALPDEAKVDVCTFGLTIIAADDTITGAEQALFEKILG